jgi:hypothetical protein
MTDTAAIVLLLSSLFYLLASAGLVPWVARQKGRSGFGWLFIALFFSPLLALIALAAVPSFDREDSTSSAESSDEPSAWQRRVTGYEEHER